MAKIVNNRYPNGAPDYMAFSVSVEDQKSADERLPYLAKIKGFKIIAIEPLLGKINLEKYISKANWVIVGSETGKNARPINLDWVRDIRNETKIAGLPFFIKQLGNNHKDSKRGLDSGEWNEFPKGFVK